MYNSHSPAAGNHNFDPELVLFLDFDGCLHPYPKSADQWLFCHLPLLENILRQHPQIRLVLTTSWRETYPWEVLQGSFSDDIQERIIGVTPSLPALNRQAEIEAWVSESHYEGPFLVIDDQAEQFAPGYPPLFLCETRIGFNERVAKKFETILQAYL